MSHESPEVPSSAELTAEESDQAYYAEVIGEVVSIPLANFDLPAFQNFYHCLLHAGMGFTGDVTVRPLLRSEDPGARLKCALCHDGLATVAYIENEIIRRQAEAARNQGVS
jgi:hypothetical protein